MTPTCLNRFLSHTVFLLPIVYSVTTILISILVNQIVTTPYIDEIFHIPQARAFCSSNFSFLSPIQTFPKYDDKITTFPGLYLFSVWISRIFPILVECQDLWFLRSINLIFLLFLPVLVSSIIDLLDERRRRGRKLASPSPCQLDSSSTTLNQTILSYTLTLTPPLYLFGFLYYTDLPSVFFVMATWKSAMSRQTIATSINALISILFRQNNLPWLLFIGCTEFIFDLQGQTFSSSSSSSSSSSKKKEDEDDKDDLKLITILQTIFYTQPTLLLSHMIPFLPSFLLCFYVWFQTGFLVLGDQSNHTFSLHLTQPLYFILFSTGLSWPFLFSHLSRRRFHLSLPSSFLLLLLPLIFLSIHYGTLQHPFLLADNRHYTFYIWKNFFRKIPLFRYFLTPIYLTCFVLWYQVLPRRFSFWFQFGLIMTTFLVLIPTPLIELRYFLIPFFFLRIHSKSSSSSSSWMMMLEIGLLGIVNLVTIFWFLYKPFEWNHDAVDIQRNESTVMRFVW